MRRLAAAFLVRVPFVLAQTLPPEMLGGLTWRGASDVPQMAISGPLEWQKSEMATTRTGGQVKLPITPFFNDDRNRTGPFEYNESTEGKSRPHVCCFTGCLSRLNRLGIRSD